MTDVLARLREQSEWSRKLDELCRPHMPEMTKASRQRIIGTLVDLEHHRRNATRPVYGREPMRYFETPRGTSGVLTDAEIDAIAAAIRKAINERFGAKP